MRLRYLPLALAVSAAMGCVEQTTPTEPFVEQAVFNALGGLRVGESITLQGAAAEQILVGGTAAGGEFIVIPFHASRTAGENLLVEITGEQLGLARPNSAIAPSGKLGLVTESTLQSWEMHEKLHERQMAAVAPLLRGVAPSFDRAPGAAGPGFDLSGSNAFVGQLVEINANALGQACTAEDRRTGRVEAITQNAIIVGDVENPNGGFTQADYEDFGRQFDQLIHPTVTRTFAQPTDIDDNDKVVVFFTRAVNELTGPDDEGFVGGFFWARDLFPVVDCAMSNEGEIFFILAPDPNAEASPIPHTRERVFRQAVATIGHEYQHLINAGRRIYINDAQQFEETWLDEGLSHIAEEVIFYEAAGLAPESNLGLERIRSSQRILDAINRYGVQNLARYMLYLEDVTQESPTNEDRLETRGAIWNFLRYAADLSDDSDPEFFGRLADTPLAGFANLAAVLEEDVLNRMQTWGVSIYADDLLENADSVYVQPSWNFRSVLPVLSRSGVFPLQVETLAPGSTERLDLLSTTSGYVLVGGAAGERTRIVITSGEAAPPDKLRVTVIRTE